MVQASVVDRVALATILVVRMAMARTHKEAHRALEQARELVLAVGEEAVVLAEAVLVDVAAAAQAVALAVRADPAGIVPDNRGAPVIVLTSAHKEIAGIVVNRVSTAW